jgi:hypothetical protein
MIGAAGCGGSGEDDRAQAESAANSVVAKIATSSGGQIEASAVECSSDLVCSGKVAKASAPDERLAFRADGVTCDGTLCTVDDKSIVLEGGGALFAERSSSDEPEEDEAPEEEAEAADPDVCQEPDSTMVGSVMFSVRASAPDAEADGDASALVKRGNTNYLAVKLAKPAGAIVLVSFPDNGKYLAAKKALNGTARSLTDLPHGGATLPQAAEQALACIDE